MTAEDFSPRAYLEASHALVASHGLEQIYKDSPLQRSHARSLFHEEQVVGHVGIFQQWEGLGVAWVLLLPAAVVHGAILARLIRRELEREWESGIWRRIQATVNVDDGPAIRFAGWLGFEVEALMQAFGPNGEAHFLYGRVRDAH